MLGVMLRRLFGAERPVEDAEGLGRYLASQAAFISQKSTVEYCRARSGLNWDKLFREVGFNEALERCRWEALGAVAVDVAVVVEGYLRPAWTGTPAALADVLSARAVEGLRGQGEPAFRPEGWAFLVPVLAERLAQAQLAEPHSAHEVARVGGGILFDLLPIHTNLRNYDREVVINGVRFWMARMADDMPRKLARDALVRDLAARVA